VMEILRFKVEVIRSEVRLTDYKLTFVSSATESTTPPLATHSSIQGPAR
jgi:hypothetical protein